MANLFEKPHDMALTTDSSGKDGFGGYADGMFFAEPLRQEWNMHLDEMPLLVSSSWIELAALFLALQCPKLAAEGKVLLWTTDCQTGHHTHPDVLLRCVALQARSLYLR